MAGRKQFDVDAAVETAMLRFWRWGYADTSVDDLTEATGLNRSSLYAAFGSKDALYRRCLRRYTERYGERYEAALARGGGDAVEAVRAFFDVTLQRIADPDVPDGCLVAQSALAVHALSPETAAHSRAALQEQRRRVRSALQTATMTSRAVDGFASHIAGVNQALAVMSRAGASPDQLHAVVDVTLEALRHEVEA